MKTPQAFEFIDDVTSDVTFVARGPTLAAVFAAAAAALLATTIESPERLGETEQRRLELAEPDLELLLVVFLNELVYLRDAEGLLLRVGHMEVHEGEGRAWLEADLVGEQMDAARHRPAAEVKAATAHGLQLVREEGGFRATVTLDV